MSRAQPVNDVLLAAMKRFSKRADLLSDVAATVGVDDYDDLGDGDEYPILGFLLRPKEVFGLFVVTPGRFCLYERNQADESLTIAIPVERVRRVVQTVSRDRVLTLTVEVEAGPTPLNLEAQAISEPRVDGGQLVEGARFARTVMGGSLSASTYSWSAEDGSDEFEKIKEFGRALRNAVGF